MPVFVMYSLFKWYITLPHIMLQFVVSQKCKLHPNMSGGGQTQQVLQDMIKLPVFFIVFSGVHLKYYQDFNILI